MSNLVCERTQYIDVTVLLIINILRFDDAEINTWNTAMFVCVIKKLSEFFGKSHCSEGA